MRMDMAKDGYMASEADMAFPATIAQATHNRYHREFVQYLKRPVRQGGFGANRERNPRVATPAPGEASQGGLPCCLSRKPSRRFMLQRQLLWLAEALGIRFLARRLFHASHHVPLLNSRLGALASVAAVRLRKRWTTVFGVSDVTSARGVRTRSYPATGPQPGLH